MIRGVSPALPPLHPSTAVGPTAADAALANRLDAALPQTQCTRCGYDDCRAYADAMADGSADINRCPPGGAEGVQRLAQLTGRPTRPLDPECGAEGPLARARIDEAWCIGCTLCLDACPVDCIIGAHKRMHTVIEADCTGCGLCLPVCPVDCIAMPVAEPSRTGWQAWSSAQADQARQRYALHRQRVERQPRENAERLQAKAEAKLADLPNQTRLSDPVAIENKRRVIEEALARARARRGA